MSEEESSEEESFDDDEANRLAKFNKTTDTAPVENLKTQKEVMGRASEAFAGYNADTEDENGGRSNLVTVRTCTKGEKRKWDKRHYCVYCKNPQSKMARHLMQKHNKEKEVATALCLPPKSKQRLQMLEKLRRKGNYQHNVEVLQKGQSEIVTYRQPSMSATAQDYLPCNICYGFFLKDEVWRNEKKCRKTMGEPEVLSKKKRRVQTAALCLVPYRGQLSKRCLEIVSRMVIDEVSHEVKNDPLICEFGDRLLGKHGRDRSKDGHVSQKMRELGRFVLAAKSLDKSVKTLQDVLVPPKFSLAVKAAKQAAGFTKSAYRYNTPSLALKIGHSLKAACDIVIGQHVKGEDEIAASRVRSFLGLVSAEWDLCVSRCARTNLEEDKWNKKEMIPLTEDVMKLHKVLKRNLPKKNFLKDLTQNHTRFSVSAYSHRSFFLTEEGKERQQNCLWGPTRTEQQRNQMRMLCSASQNWNRI